MKLGKWDGFTLIELMISIAILAITLSIASSAILNLASLNREVRYGFSLQNSPHQLSYLRSLPFETLPPEQVPVQADGVLQVSQRHLVEGTLQVLNPKTLEQIPVEVLSLEEGKIKCPLSLSGQNLLVDYQFALPNQNETHFLSSDRSLQLRNRPVLRVDRVLICQGSEIRALSDYQLDENGVLQLPSAEPQQLVVVDYLGENYQNQVRAEFLDSNFQTSKHPTETKQLYVSEKYKGPGRFSLSLLKEKGR